MLPFPKALAKERGTKFVVNALLFGDLLGIARVCIRRSDQADRKDNQRGYPILLALFVDLTCVNSVNDTNYNKGRTHICTGLRLHGYYDCSGWRVRCGRPVHVVDRNDLYHRNNHETAPISTWTNLIF